MPMDTRAVSGSPGMALGCSGFSWNSTMRPSASTAMTPKALASASGTFMQATVRSAAFSSWAASMAA